MVVRILAAFREPASFGHHAVPLATSIGVAELSPGEAPATPETMLQRADTAMYHAKRAGKGRAVTWTPQLDTGSAAVLPSAHPTQQQRTA